MSCYQRTGVKIRCVEFKCFYNIDVISTFFCLLLSLVLSHIEPRVQKITSGGVNQSMLSTEKSHVSIGKSTCNNTFIIFIYLLADNHYTNKPIQIQQMKNKDLKIL